MNNQSFKSLLLLLLLGFIWGTGYSIARFAMTNGVPPLGYGFWQSLGPAVLIGLIVKFTSLPTPRHCEERFMRRSNLSKDCFDRKKHGLAMTGFGYNGIAYYFICGLTGIVIPNTTMYFAAPHLPAGLLAVVVNTVPIFAYAMALLGRLESFNFVRFAGILLAVCGLGLIILPKTSLPSPHMIPWILTSLITPFSFAFCAVYIARFSPANIPPLKRAAGTLIASTLLLLPLVLYTQNFYHLHFPLTRPDEVIVLEIILSSIGYLLFFKLVEIAGPVYYSLVDTIVALTGLFWGYVIFHEHLNQWTSAAVLCILFALLFTIKKQQVVVEYSRQNQ